MKKDEIKKAVGLVQRELTKYGLMTPGKGIDFKVSIMVEQIENDRGRVVPHLVAVWSETFPLCVDETIIYRYSETSKCEEMNRYFCPELFAKGITQRAEWIKADHLDQVEYLKSEPFGHPALYPVWKESQKVSV
tara:strand:- start:175 stop:576 length:402 start_codon:yes stop_codon:yes gene_type:complete